MNRFDKAPFPELETGTITDSDVNDLATAGHLIGEEFDSNSLKQACYELRASTIFYETGSGRENTRVNVEAGGSYVLRPHTYVTAITMEALDLPSNVLGRILTKGQLFSVGLLPVNTYADPGFKGRLGITLYNTSHRYLVIRPKQPIAKIEFSVLSKSVKVPYHGQHGFATGIWPIPTDMYATSEDLARARIDPSELTELSLVYGREFSELARRFRYYERRVWLQIFLTVMALLAVSFWVGQINWAGSIALGVTANLLTQLIFRLGAARQK